MQRDFVPDALGNAHAVMDRIGGARRDQTHIDHRARGPCIALVDGIAVLIDLQRAIEMRAFFHRTFAVIFDHSTPEDSLILVVRSFEFEPGVVGVYSTAGEEVADFFRAHDNLYAHRVSAAKDRPHAIKRRGNRSRLAGCGGNLSFCFFTYRKRSRSL